MPQINWNMVATLVIAGVILYVIQIAIVRKKIDPATGKVSNYLGTDEKNIEI